MSKELIERLKDYSSSIMGMDQLAKEAADRIEALEDERDKLREHVTMLRDALLTCSVGDFSTGHVIHPSFDEKLVEEALAATEQKP